MAHTIVEEMLKKQKKDLKNLKKRYSEFEDRFNPLSIHYDESVGKQIEDGLRVFLDEAVKLGPIAYEFIGKIYSRLHNLRKAMDKHETLINPLLNAIAKRETQDIPLTLPVRDPNSETDFSVRP